MLPGKLRVHIQASQFDDMMMCWHLTFGLRMKAFSKVLQSSGVATGNLGGLGGGGVGGGGGGGGGGVIAGVILNAGAGAGAADASCFVY